MIIKNLQTTLVQSEPPLDFLPDRYETTYDEVQYTIVDNLSYIKVDSLKSFLEIGTQDIVGITSSADQINYLSISQAGTVEASRAIISDDNSEINFPNNSKIKFGDNSSFLVYHDGSNAFLDSVLGELRISAEIGSSSNILIGNSSSHVQIGQDLTASGVIIGHKDNATSLRVKGAAHANDVGNADPDGDVQSYSGIFTNDVYNQASHAGTKNTRFITGGNIGMDVVTQSAHGLHLVAGDGTQTDGEILMASKNGLKINTRVNPYAVTAPRYLQIDRVDKNTLDSNNTSDVEISVNAGNLVISSNTEIDSVDLTGQSVDLNLNSNKITNLANPTANGDAANKAYVDEVAQGIVAKPSVLAATTQNLAGTYDNGALGVGGTLNLGSSAALDIDGVTTWSQYDGVLVKDQTNAEENGRYYVSQIGDASTDWILTRCMYCDEADEIPGAYVFVASGTVNEGTGWVQVVADPSTFTVGTDSISIYQFSSSGSVGAGNGLTQNGNILDVNVDNFSIEIDVNDNIKIRSAGVTSAMLAGSIANSKLNPLTTANKVALSSMDIDGATELNQAITDSDLLIVDNGGTGSNNSLLASRIPEYTFSKVSGDASIDNAGSLSLSSTAITGQSAKTVINDNDIILISDSEDSNNLKKMTKSDFVDGLSVSSNMISTLGVSSANPAQVNRMHTFTALSGTTCSITLPPVADVLDGDFIGFSRLNPGDVTINVNSADTNTYLKAAGFSNAQSRTIYNASSEFFIRYYANGANGVNWYIFESPFAEVSKSGDYTDLINTPTNSDAFTGNHAATNYTANTTNTITEHLSAIDTELGNVGGTDLANIASNVLPSPTNQWSLGSGTQTWGDLYLGDDSVIKFGNDQEVTLTHNHNTGLTLETNSYTNLTLKSSTSSTTGPFLTLKNTSNSPNEKTGEIYFEAYMTDSLSNRTTGKINCIPLAHTHAEMTFAVEGGGTREPLKVRGESDGRSTVKINTHNGTNSGLVLGSTLLTSTATELNALDISVENPSDNDVLTYTSANGLHWAAAASGGSTTPSIVFDSTQADRTALNFLNTTEAVYFINNSNTAVTVTLPTASFVSGKKYNIKRLGTANVTVTGNGSETIDGSPNFVITSQYSSVTVIAYNSQWFII